MSLKDDKKALVDEVTLADAGILDGAELSVKDLGPQISWRDVFLVEYVRVLPCLSYCLVNVLCVGRPALHISDLLPPPSMDLWRSCPA